MAQVTYTNLFSEARNNVVTLISNSSNVSDPITPTSVFRKWIYSREPDVKDASFEGYPFIIIHPVDFGTDEESNGSLDGKSKRVFWDVEIEIVTSDRGYGQKDGQGLTYMDSISNNIAQTLLNITNRNTLSNQSMKFVRPTTTAVSTEIVSNELVYRRSILLSFQSRIQVSV